MNRKLRISQCMIVKNEEKNIEKALSWGKNIMWEQIVVDTGSTDRTVELAKELGAAVYHFPWINDFAAAKNYACDQASGDWIAFLDADEYMEGEDAEKVYRLLENLTENQAPYQVVITNWFHLDAGGNVFMGGIQMRFFRNRPEIRYTGRIHEYLVDGGRELAASEVLDACEELIVYHTGYTAQAVSDAGKTKRNEEILLLELEKRPEDADVMGNLADVYKAMEDYDRAIEWYKKAVHVIQAGTAGPQVWNQRMSWTFSYLLDLLRWKKREEEEILEVYGQAVYYLPRESDFDYILGIHYLAKNHWEKAAYHLGRALELFEAYGSLGVGQIVAAKLMKIHEDLAISYYNAGQKKKSVQTCVSYLKESPLAMGVLKVLLTAFRGEAGDEGAGQVLDFLRQLYDFGSLKERLFVLKAAKEAGYQSIYEAVWNLFSPAEQEALSGLV